MDKVDLSSPRFPLRHARRVTSPFAKALGDKTEDTPEGTRTLWMGWICLTIPWLLDKVYNILYTNVQNMRICHEIR